MGLFGQSEKKGIMKSCFFYAFLMGTCFLQATSLRLQNETHHSLQATVRGADGSILGEVMVEPQETVVWSDEATARSFRPPSKSMSPFSVYWSCADGETYCISDHATAGALIKTSQCVGKKACNPPKKESE